MSPWNLECELDGRDRDYGFSFLTRPVSQVAPGGEDVKELAITGRLVIAIMGGVAAGLGGLCN